MMKATKAFLEYLLIFLISFLSIDLVVSNTTLNLKNKNCNKIEKFYLELKKNCSGKEKIRPFLPTVNIFTDREGLRIKEKHERSESEKVFVFGSSFIYGAGVEYEKSVIGLLEEKHKDFEFYNFSIPWGSPTFHLYRIKQKLNSGSIPKKIIMVLSMSDILNETSIWNDYDISGKPVLIDSGLYEKSNEKEEFHKKNFRLSRSMILNLRNKIRSIKDEKNHLDNSKVRTTIQAGFTYTPLIKLGNFYTEDSFNNGQVKIKNRVDEMLKITRKNNIEFYLAIFPFADTLEYGQNYFDWEQFASTLCPSESCNLVNSFPEYKNFKKNEKNWYKKLFFEGDEHFTELGHTILANKFTNQIF